MFRYVKTVILKTLLWYCVEAKKAAVQPTQLSWGGWPGVWLRVDTELPLWSAGLDPRWYPWGKEAPALLSHAKALKAKQAVLKYVHGYKKKKIHTHPCSSSPGSYTPESAQTFQKEHSQENKFEYCTIIKLPDHRGLQRRKTHCGCRVRSTEPDTVSSKVLVQARSITDQVCWSQGVMCLNGYSLRHCAGCRQYHWIESTRLILNSSFSP